MPVNVGRVMGGATSGLGQALGALAMGGRAEQQGYDAESLNQSRIAQALAQIQAAQETARLHGAQADDKLAEIARSKARPALVDAAMASAAGVDVPTLGAYRQRLNTGQAPQVPMGPPAEDGSMGVGSAQFTPEQQSRIGQALQRFLPVAMAEKDVNPEQWAKAQGIYRGMDLGDQVLAGTRKAGDVGRAQAAVEAKPLYHFDASGLVGDLFGGGVDLNNPRARAYTGEIDAKAGQARAAAGASKASAEKTRAETDQIVNAPKGRYDPERGVLVDERAGTARPVIGPDGKPLGAKDKGLNDSQGKALLFGARMAIADEILTGLGNKPSFGAIGAKNAVQEIPLVGGMSGASLNSVLSDATQQADQAQQDFINAVLRRESGAVISPTEFANGARQYFPQVGDSEAVLRQKAANRRAAIAGIKAEAGPAGAADFERIVNESRSARAKPGQAPRAGGASGDWGDQPAPNGQRVVRVPY